MTTNTVRVATLAAITAAEAMAVADMENALHELPFWENLTAVEKETLQHSTSLQHYQKGTLIHNGDKECLGLLLVLSGEIRTFLLSDEGREVTLFRLYPNDFCVLPA